MSGREPYLVKMEHYREFQAAKHPKEVGGFAFEDLLGTAYPMEGKITPETMLGTVYVLGWLNGFDHVRNEVSGWAK